MRFEPLLAGCLLAVSVSFGGMVDHLAAPYELAGVPARMPPGDRVWARLAARKARADAVWFDLLQYCADSAFVLDHGARVSPLAGRIIALDPGFRRVYMFAGSLLMWQCNRPTEATRLLEQGIEANPKDQWLKYYLAAFTYSRLKDLSREVAVLERLAFAEDAPIILRRILANAYEAQHRLDRAAAVWKLVDRVSADPSERRWAERKLARYGMTSR